MSRPMPNEEDAMTLVFLTIQGAWSAPGLDKPDAEMLAVPRPPGLEDDESAWTAGHKMLHAAWQVLDTSDVYTASEVERMVEGKCLVQSYGIEKEHYVYAKTIARMRIQRAVDHGGLRIQFNKEYHDKLDRPATIDKARLFLHQTVFNDMLKT